MRSETNCEDHKKKFWWKISDAHNLVPVIRNDDPVKELEHKFLQLPHQLLPFYVVNISDPSHSQFILEDFLLPVDLGYT